MRDGLRHRRVGGTDPVVIYASTHRWQRSVMFVVLLVSSGLLFQGVHAAERARPLRIGVLTASWGPTPQVIGLRDGLRELGYRDHEHFFLGIRFTQGDTAALVADARKLVQDGAELLFADADDSARAAQMATTRVPIVFAGVADPIGTGLVHSFPYPGGNVTGKADLGLDSAPNAWKSFGISSRIAARPVPVPCDRCLLHGCMKLYHDAARSLGIVLVEQAVRSEEEAQAKLTQSHKGDVDDILAPLSLAFNLPGRSSRLRPSAPSPPCLASMAGFWWSTGTRQLWGRRLRLRPGRRHVW